MKQLTIILGLLFCFIITPSFAQDEGDPCVQKFDKQTEKNFKKARDLQIHGKKADANAIYRDILDAYPEHLEANYYLALSYYLPIELNNLYIERKQDAKVIIDAADRMYAVCPYHRIKIHLYAARVAYLTEDFASAIKHAKVLIENPDLVKEISDIEEAEMIISKSKFFDQLLNNPVPFEPHAIEGISTENDEYLATLSPDGEFFYFTRRQPVQEKQQFGTVTIDKELFSYSQRNTLGGYGVGQPLPYPFNESSNEGSPTINLSNDLLIFAKMTEVKLKDPTTNKEYMYPNYDLYYATFDGSDWSDPRSLGDKINRPDSWESQPSLSSDGNVLFFASDRANGSYGGTDIWMSERDANGNWQNPVNLGATINTKGNERSPFLHTDSKTLYFSSSGHDGMGGQDIFYSKMTEKGTWSKPVNIGYPINSENDEVDFFVSLNGQTAYFSSNNLEMKDWNIYRFELYEAARPKSMMIVKGIVSTDDKERVEAVVELRDENAKIISTTKANENTGQYALATEVVEEKEQNLIVNIKQEGYAYDTKMLTIPAESDQNVITSDAEVKKIEVGKICDLHDIYFKTNSFTLTPTSEKIVDFFAEFLKNNPTIKVEIQGHTDDVGNDQTNLILSEHRAEAVYNYLITKGIPKNRMTYKGYGESKPIASNATEAGRAKNRRTVFLINEQ